MNESEIKYIAHPGQSLEDHLVGVADKAKKFASKIGLSEQGELIGLLHDLGKYSEEFQSYIGSAIGLIDPDEDEYVDAGVLKGKIDHSSAGAQYIWKTLSNKGELERIVAQLLALCVASHHSGLIDCISSSAENFGEDTFSKRMQKIREKTHVDEVLQVADARILSRSVELLDSTTLTEGIKSIIKKILSNNMKDGQLNECIAQQQIGLAVRFLFSCLIDADRIDTADVEHKRVKDYRPQGKYTSWPVLLDRFECHLRKFSSGNLIDELRREISEHCLHAASRNRGIYTLTVPTGGGKTLASLRFALHHAQKHGLDRIVYVIPFTSIIDQNAQVFREILEPDNAPEDRGKVVLEQHASITPEHQTWREKILCENWDSPVVCTTMVQFLESLFGAGTRGARRMHQLASAVLIFDEIQTLPIKCVHLFNNAINFLSEQCNSTVMLCTATQPLLHQVSAKKGAIRLMPGHEIMPDVPKLFENLKRVEMLDRRKPGGWTYAEVTDLALSEMRRVNSCLVIVNTKDAARKAYESCHAGMDSEVSFHLSTDMCPSHRKQELNKVKLRLGCDLPVLCVSTQLIEAGVDIDFDVVIRFTAGLDSIAQAAGRCNRNARHDRGIVHIVNPQEESLAKLPDISVGRDKTNRVLDDYARQPCRYPQDLVGPEALNDYYRYYFFERQSEMDYRMSANNLGHDDTLLNLLSLNDKAVCDYGKRYGIAPDFFLRQSFMTAAKAFRAIDAPTQAVIVPFGNEGRELIAKMYGAYDVEKEFALLRAAQQFTVNVFPHVLQKLKDMGAVHEVKPDARILCLDERYYHSKFGLATERVSGLETLYA